LSMTPARCSRGFAAARPYSGHHTASGSIVRAVTWTNSRKRVCPVGWLTERIRAIHRDSRGTYGSPRVHAELGRQGVRVGCKRVERLMRAAGLEGAYQRRRRRGTTIRVAGVRPAEDLVDRNFRPDAPNRLWAADIKQIKTGEGWLYVAAVQDLFSRRIVGWAMAEHMRVELVVDALEMAVRTRRPTGAVIHHSDQGSLGGFNRSSQRFVERGCGE
jgi:putative transposase